MLRIETYEQRQRFAPGEAVNGLVAWEFEDPPPWIEVRLFWKTFGKGDTDLIVVGTTRFDDPAAADAQLYELVLPAGPQSYAGQMLEIRWGVEAVAQGVKEAASVELSVVAHGVGAAGP